MSLTVTTLGRRLRKKSKGETKSPSKGFICWIIENDKVPKCTKEELMEWWNSLVLEDDVPKLPITDVPKVWNWASKSRSLQAMLR